MSFFHPFRDRKKVKKQQELTLQDKQPDKTDPEKSSTDPAVKQRSISTNVAYDLSKSTGKKVKPVAQDSQDQSATTLANLESVTATRESIESDIKSIYSRLHEVQNSLKDNLNRESGLIQDQIAYSDSKRRMVDRKSEHIRNSIDDVKSKLAELDLKKLDAQVAQLRERKQITEDDQHNNEVRITSIQQQIAESKKQRGALQQDIRNLEADKNDLFVQLKSEDKVEVFLEKAELVRNQIKALTKQQDQKAADIEKMVDREKQLQETTEKVTEQNKTLQDRLNDIETTIEQIGHRRNKWQADIGEYEASLKDLNAQLVATTQSSEALEKQRGEWDKRLKVVQQKLLQFTNANVSTSNIDLGHGSYYFYTPDVPQITQENQDVIRGYEQFFKQRHITPILLTTAYNEEGQRQLSELKRKGKIDNQVTMINLYDDLQGRLTTRIPKKIAFTPDPTWRKEEAKHANQIQYFNVNDEVVRVVVYRPNRPQIWMINYFEMGQLMKRDVFDHDGYLSVTQTFDILDHNQIKEERFYKDDGSVRLVKHYDTFAGDLIDIQVMDDQELLFNVFHSEVDFEANWIRQKISEQDQSRLMINVSYPGFAQLAGSGSASYSLIPILDSMNQDKLKDALDRANLVQTVATDDEKKAQQFQDWFGQRYSIWVIKKADYDPNNFHMVLPNVTGGKQASTPGG